MTICTLVVVISWFACSTQAQTIDEIIKGAAGEDVEAFQFNDDGSVRVEYDILLTAEQWADLDEIHSDYVDEETRAKRKAVYGDRYRWTNNVIPYVISNRFSSNAKNTIKNSMRTWEKYLCVTFKPRSGERNYINIVNSGGCSSYIGMTGGAQKVTLGSGCVYQHVIMHELGHAIGFNHEQCRNDRDDYVTVYLQNVAYNMRHNYNKKNTDNRDIKYDYGSIMHYGQYAFSSNGKITMKAKDPTWQSKMGNARMMTFNDLKLANVLYKCAGECQGGCPNGGYKDKNCVCQCRGSPLTQCSDDGTDSGTDSGETDCQDYNDRCEEWAQRGECGINPNYMLHNCPRACSQCVCEDKSGECPTWQERGECNNNPYYMLYNCPVSCRQC